MVDYKGKRCNLPAVCYQERNMGIEAIKIILSELKSMGFASEIGKGYEEMGQINLSIAEFGYEQDYIELKLYEAKLTGCGVYKWW